ncbi:MAG: hypothetical protein WC615_00280 [Mucilaginibacter sp.]|jgi:hypothetical protein|uniref:hypothetical protein n=1 Tax=Mucilaginibacter sp. TaxID=1882438 RepID=UPI00356AC13C
MKSISEFVKEVTFSRKRTGIILLNDPELLKDFENCGLKLLNFAYLDFKKVIMTDDELIALILGIEPRQPTLLLNLEIFLAPRFKDLKYLDYLLAKLAVKEPKLPIFLAFYSEILFETFRNFYASQTATETHIYEEY